MDARSTDTRRQDGREDAGEPGRPADARPKRLAKGKLDRLVAVCAKCAKRQGIGRREIGRRLERALRRASPGCKTRVVGTKCLGPCPKRAIAVATSESLRSRHVLLLDPGLPPAAIRDLLPRGEAGAGDVDG